MNTLQQRISGYPYHYAQYAGSEMSIQLKLKLLTMGSEQRVQSPASLWAVFHHWNGKVVRMTTWRPLRFCDELIVRSTLYLCNCHAYLWLYNVSLYRAYCNYFWHRVLNDVCGIDAYRLPNKIKPLRWCFLRHIHCGNLWQPSGPSI